MQFGENVGDGGVVAVAAGMFESGVGVGGVMEGAGEVDLRAAEHIARDRDVL